MITIEKIKIYELYEGDVDSFGRGATRKEKLIISEDEFIIIRNLLQDIKLLKNGLAAKVYEEKVKYALHENCADEQTILYLEALA